MNCTHQLAGDGPVCIRLDPHDPEADGGHVYESSTGSSLEAHG